MSSKSHAPAPQESSPESDGITGAASSLEGAENSVLQEELRSARGGGDPEATPTLDAAEGADMTFTLEELESEDGVAQLGSDPEQSDMTFTIEEVEGTGEARVVQLDEVTITADPGQLAAAERLGALQDPEATAEQRAEAAVASREALEDSLAGLSDLDDAQRAAIRGRVEGLEGEALVREMEMIEDALSGPNADRAMATLSDIEALRAEHPDSADRLSTERVAMLVGGVADSRSDSDRGQEGILGRNQARTAAESLLTMNDENFEAMSQLLDHAGTDEDGNAVAGADAGTEQALLLEALASRAPAMQTHLGQDIWQWVGGETDATRAMDEIRGFAGDIRGMERRELVRQTTLMDVHDENDSTVDPDHILGPADTVGDNDGLFQRFAHSCGPTTAQILRAEADPIYAMRVHRDGIANADPHSETAEEQRRVLEENGGGAVSRLGRQARQDVRQSLDQMMAEGTLTQAQRASISNLVLNPDELDDADRAAAEAELERVREANGGRPTEAEVAAMREDHGRASRGMELDPALNAITSPATGTEYTATETDLESDPAALDDVARRLRDGEDVPFRIGYDEDEDEGHFMSITDVRSDPGGGRSFLVTDPLSGATRWVSESDLTEGGGLSDTFGLDAAHVTHTYGAASP